MPNTSPANPARSSRYRVLPKLGLKTLLLGTVVIALMVHAAVHFYIWHLRPAWTVQAIEQSGGCVTVGQLDIYDVATSQLLRRCAAHSQWIFGITFGNHGTTIATGGGDDLINLWNSTDGKHLATLSGHTDDVHAVAYSQDGSTIYSAGDDMTVRSWPLRAGIEETAWHGHSGPVTSLAVMPCGGAVITGSRDDSVRIWNPSTGQARHVLDEPADDIISVAPHPSEQVVAAASYDHNIYVWTLTPSVQLQHVLRGHESRVYTARFTARGDAVVSGDDDGILIIWDLTTGEPRRMIMGEADVADIAFLADGTAMATCSSDGTIAMWDAATWKRSGILPVLEIRR